MPRATRATVLLLIALSIALLLPGLFLPVLTIRGVLTRDGIAHVAPTLLDQGLDQETINTLKSLMNPSVVAFMEARGVDMKKTLLERLGPRITASLQKSGGDVEVYQQTRSIVGSVRRLYEVGSPVPATLILLFSVVVPVTKAALVAWTMFVKNEEQRRRTLTFVVSIAKWSMADVFVVALFIAYLAAQASTTTTGPDAAPPLLAFDARFGSGFYWFAAYCLFSLATQQYTHRFAMLNAEGRMLE
jgi:hypothetical protein